MIVEHRYSLVRYVVLYTLFAAGYAAAFGIWAGLPVRWIALDGAVFALACGLTGSILRNVLRYGVVGDDRTSVMKGVFVVVVGVMYVAIVVGAEVAALYAAVDIESLRAFPPTIPARALLVAVIYVCFSILHLRAPRLEDDLSYDTAAPELDGVCAPAVEPLERITLRGAGGKIEIIDVDEIICLGAEGDYVAIVTAGGRWLKEGTMKYFEGALPQGRFVRVHRSYIVSVGHISRIETSGREHTVVMRNGTPIRISDTGYKLLRRALNL